MSENKIRTFLAAPTDQQFRLALDPSYAEVMKVYLGEEAFQEYVNISLKIVKSLDQKHLGIHTPKNLIFIPGIMGSLLESRTLGGVWWIDSLNWKRINDLKLSPDGLEDANPEYQVAAFNIHTIYTAFFEAVLKCDDFNHDIFPYDWRKPLIYSTVALRDRIIAIYNTNGHNPVHLVAHSMGGLVVRATLMEYGSELWPKVGRIAFIGTPHYGSPAIGGYLKNHLWGFDYMLLLGRIISRETFRSLWGVLNLLPAPQGIYPGTRQKQPLYRNTGELEETSVHPSANFDMYQAESWKLELSPEETSQLQHILNGTAELYRKMYQSHRMLDQDLRNRMAVIAGVGYQTLFSLSYRSDIFGLWEHMQKVKKRIIGDPHREGDGRVPLASALLEDVGAVRYVKGTHEKLPMMPEVYTDVFRWLKGESMRLPKTPKGALSTHLAGGSVSSETPHLDGSVIVNSTDDDPGYWNMEEPNPAHLADLQAKLESGQLPEFITIRLL